MKTADPRAGLILTHGHDSGNLGRAALDNDINQISLLKGLSVIRFFKKSFPFRCHDN